MMRKLMMVMVLCNQFSTSFAGTTDVGTRFTYQGELIDSGSPANGTYDLLIQLYTVPTGGSSIDFQQVDDIEIVNGLFSTELDFGDVPFSGDESYLEINVRPGDSTAGYEILLPRSRVNVTPYAIQAAFVENNDSPWEVINEGVVRSVADIAVGQGAGSLSTAKATINSASNQDALRVRVSGGTKFVVQADGGVAIGTNEVASANGLVVEGAVQQSLDQHGFAKAGITFTCGNSSTNIQSQFNNQNAGNFVVTSNLPEDGRCEVEVPFDTSDVYMSVTTNTTLQARGAACGVSAGDVIICAAWDPLTDTRTDTILTLLLF